MPISSIQELYQTLPQLSAAYRSAPFWGWNDRLTPAELTRQLRDMKDKGMGGAFIHSREGLETPYLSKEWLDDAALCADEARKLGMELWIYDEDKWPSGGAGGMVSAADPDAYTAKGLTLEVLPADAALPEEPPNVRVVGDYRGQIRDGRLLALGEGDRHIILRRELSAPSEWYNGFAPPDNLDPDAVRCFLELTHEAYRERLGGKLKGSVNGFFTDEPNCCDFYSRFTPGRPWLPWTDRFPEVFREKRGYDPLPKLPLLFFDGEGSPKLRHDYWRTITELFGESYMKQLYEYCEAHGVELTGHILYENDLGYNVRVCGAAMPQYRWLHRPGIDLLGEQAREYLTVKQCSSVANQYGRKNTISETYGCTGWEFDFEGQKWLGDWQFVNGITRRCQHLALYSVSGCRKRDYPPVFNYQNTWWEHNAAMEDYFGRLSACVRTGTVVRSILVIHPISSIWTLCGSDPNEDLGRVEMNMGWTDAHITRLNELGDAYNRMAEALVRNHLDFDFGDETILSEDAAVEGDRLRVGQRYYTTIVVPEVLSLFASTAELLERFASAGGHILWVGEPPALLEGEPSDRLCRLANSGAVARVADCEALLRALDGGARVLSARSVTGGEDTDILTMLRETEDGWVLLAVNHDRSGKHFVTFRLPGVGRVTGFDPWTGATHDVPVSAAGNALAFAEPFAPCESRVYWIEREKAPLLAPIRVPYEHPHRAERVFAVLGPVAAARRTQPNALVLDHCSYRLADEPFSEEMELWRAQRAIRDRLGMPQVYYNGAPQRYTWLGKSAARGERFALRFRFTVRDIPDGACRLAVEKPEGLRLTCNGEEATLTDEWYSDRAMRCFELPRLREGDNELLLTGDYTEARELEDVFLIGDFAVDPAREITRESDSLRFGDWCLQGYPHYSGGMVYTFPLPAYHGEGRILLQLGEYRAAVAEATVNGKSAGLLFGRGRSTLDITEYLRAGGNTLALTLIAPPRNLYGPFHQAYNGCSRISWEDFRTDGITHCEEYVLEPYGIMGQITLTIQ